MSDIESLKLRHAELIVMQAAEEHHGRGLAAPLPGVELKLITPAEGELSSNPSYIVSGLDGLSHIGRNRFSDLKTPKTEETPQEVKN